MRRASAVIDELAAAVPPASGAVVMGTGIVSIGLSLDGREALSRALVGIAGAVWIVLGLQLLACVPPAAAAARAGPARRQP